MNIKIIADSCCDMTEALRKRLDLRSVALTLRLGEKEFRDDEALDLSQFMREMKACKEKVGSASPSPSEYQQAFCEAGSSFAITLSSQLSGSYESAMLAARAAAEEGAQVHVFDSRSASAGEVLLACKLSEFLQKNLSREAIIERVNAFIDEMKTYFVLENYDNLKKNGRLSRVTGALVSILGIRLVMGADAQGNIQLYHKARGENQMLERLLSLIQQSGREVKNQLMVITHCNNLRLAEKLQALVRERFDFGEILIVPTRGISSLYADDQGIVMAF